MSNEMYLFLALIFITMLIMILIGNIMDAGYMKDNLKRMDRNYELNRMIYLLQEQMAKDQKKSIEDSLNFQCKSKVEKSNYYQSVVDKYTEKKKSLNKKGGK